MKAKLAEAGSRFRAIAGEKHWTEWRSALEFPTKTWIRTGSCGKCRLPNMSEGELS